MDTRNTDAGLELALASSTLGARLVALDTFEVNEVALFGMGTT
jgi:hypothetical protein